MMAWPIFPLMVLASFMVGGNTVSAFVVKHDHRWKFFVLPHRFCVVIDRVFIELLPLLDRGVDT